MDSPPGLEVNTQPSNLDAYPDQGPQVYDPYSWNESDNWKASNDDMKPGLLPPKSRVCGLSRRIFWICIVVAAAIVVAVALGVGLGLGLSKERSSANVSPQQMPTLSTSSTASSNANLVFTAQVGTVNGTSATLYRDCPSTNNSLYSVQYSSTTYEFRKLCNIRSPIHVQGNNWVSQPTSSLNDCINLCAAWNQNNVTNSDAGNVCSTVCWRHGFINDDWPGQCFGFTTTNTSSGSDNIPDDICDSAIWINQT